MTRTASDDRPCWTTIGIWGRDEPRCAELPRVVHCRNCEVFADHARRLLDREPPPDYGGDWAALTAEALAEQERTTRPVLIFRLGDEHLALDVPWVGEVVDWRVFRSVPHRRDDLLVGIANVSGELRLCVSLEVLFGTPRPDVRAPRPSGRLLVVSRDGHDWAIPVDQALAIHRLAESEMEPAPSTVARSSQAYLRGMFTWRDRRVGMLDGDLVLGAIARRLA